MRRFDKKRNMTKANLLAEQRYLESKGLIKEDETPMELVIVPDMPTTDASKFQVRFNLNNIADPITGKKIFRTWKVEPNGKTGYLGDDKLEFNPSDLVDKVPSGGVRNNFDPRMFDIDMTNCKLTNRVETAYNIYLGSNKTPFAYIKCDDVMVSLASNSPGSPDSEVIYNPMVAPYWRMRTNDVFQDLTGEPVDMDENIPSYKEGVIYRAPITKVKTGKDSFYMSRFFAVKLGGKLYVKEIKDGPGVDDYKTNAQVFIDVDGQSFGKLYTSGTKIYAG